MTWEKKRSPIKSETKSSITSRLTEKSSKTRKNRDKLTRVTSPIKGIMTNAKQGNRWTP